MSNSKPKAVILLSGGLDSATCLAYANTQNFACYALSFDYNQRHGPELLAAKQLADKMPVEQHNIIPIAVDQLSASALTDSSQPIPEYSSDDQIPATYVPARNIIFLALALSWAESLGASSIFIGASSIDYSGYPDCRPEFIDAFAHMAEVGTKMGAEGNPVQIQAPLMHMSKAETIALGTKLGVPYQDTVSCYQADNEGRACGYCDSCILRKRGFDDAQICDPTRYKP